MCKIRVEIDLGENVTADSIDETWFQEDGRIVIDEAFLERAEEDNSFYALKLTEIKEDV